MYVKFENNQAVKDRMVAKAGSVCAEPIEHPCERCKFFHRVQPIVLNPCVSCLRVYRGFENTRTVAIDN